MVTLIPKTLAIVFFMLMTINSFGQNLGIAFESGTKVTSFPLPRNDLFTSSLERRMEWINSISLNVGKRHKFLEYGATGGFSLGYFNHLTVSSTDPHQKDPIQTTVIYRLGVYSKLLLPEVHKSRIFYYASPQLLIHYPDRVGYYNIVSKNTVALDHGVGLLYNLFNRFDLEGYYLFPWKAVRLQLTYRLSK